MIINIIRNNQTITNPPSECVLQEADQLILFGSHSAIDLGLKILNETKTTTHQHNHNHIILIYSVNKKNTICN